MVLYWMRARRLHVQCACTWTKGGYPHRSFSLWTELNWYIHCRRMQYDLVVLLHFSATHGPLFVTVFSKEQKKKHRILYRVFSIYFHSDSGSDSKRFDPCHFPIYTRPPNLFLCADVLYIHHTHRVYICTPENSLLLVAVRRWVSVLYVCTMNVPSNTHFYIGFDSFLCLVAIDCKSEIRCTVHTHISYTIHARAPLQSIAVVRRSSDKEQDGEKGNSTWKMKTMSDQILSKNTPTLAHTNKHAFILIEIKPYP